MPSRNEADPAVLLAIAVPLMFGYMFGDVGQGLVIAAAAFAVRKRFPIARLFIAGGLAAIVFGFLFGSVFSIHMRFRPSGSIHSTTRCRSWSSRSRAARRC